MFCILQWGPSALPFFLRCRLLNGSRGLPEPVRASADHRLAFTRDALEPGEFLPCRGEGLKPALYLEAFAETGTIGVFNVVVADCEPGFGGGNLTPGQRLPARVV